jgi:hypothetical protein
MRGVMGSLRRPRQSAEQHHRAEGKRAEQPAPSPSAISDRPLATHRDVSFASRETIWPYYENLSKILRPPGVQRQHFLAEIRKFAFRFGPSLINIW